MTQDPVLTVHDEGPARWLTLNRPDHGNSFTPEMLAEASAISLNHYGTPPATPVDASNPH